MNRKLIAGMALVAAGALIWATVAIVKQRSGPPVTVTLRVAVSPAEQVAFVARRGNSKQFKYLVGKQSGVKPVLAQKLAFKPVAQTSLVEARIGVLTQEEGRRYVDAFVPTLQDLCGQQTQLTLAAQSVR